MRNQVLKRVAVFFLAFMVVSAIAVTLIRSSRHATCSADDAARMRIAMDAVFMYAEGKQGRLPRDVIGEAGEPLVSWRYSISPFLDSAKMDFEIVLNDSWHSEVYAEWRKFRQSAFCKDDSRHTQFAAVAGIGSVWDTVQFAQELPVNAILLVEVTPQWHWMEPRDISTSRIRTLESKGQASLGELAGVKGGILVAFSDGTVRCLNSALPIQVFQQFVFADSARSITNRVTLDPYTISID